MTAYRWLLFDADGTLFDFESAQEGALVECWTAAGHPRDEALLERFREINAELWHRYERGDTTQERLRLERFERLLGATGRTGPAEALADSYVECLARRGTLYDGVAELLEELRRRHVLALVTNGIAEVQRSRVRLSGVEELFASVVISGEVGAAKPDERFFDAAFESLGRPPREEALIIGDSLSSDVEGGRRYGVATCWLNPSGAAMPEGVEPPTHELRRLADLRTVLAGEGAPSGADD